MEDYYLAALTTPAILGVVEDTIARLGVGATFTFDGLCERLPGGTPRDQVRTILYALTTVNVVEQSTDGLFRIREPEIGRSERSHVRSALEWVSGSARSLRVGLLVSAPAIAAEQTTVPFQRYFGDLRTAVRGLIASARSHLLLASPFWDVGVVSDITVLLERRLAAGVRVEVLARAPGVGSENARALSLLAGIRGNGVACKLRILEEPSDVDPFGKATFHFKAAIADEEQAYIGSANFNTAGMASRWELGVLLSGALGRRVSQLMQSLFDSSRPMEMP